MPRSRSPHRFALLLCSVVLLALAVPRGCHAFEEDVPGAITDEDDDGGGGDDGSAVHSDSVPPVPPPMTFAGGTIDADGGVGGGSEHDDGAMFFEPVELGEILADGTAVGERPIEDATEVEEWGEPSVESCDGCLSTLEAVHMQWVAYLTKETKEADEITKVEEYAQPVIQYNAEVLYSLQFGQRTPYTCTHDVVLAYLLAHRLPALLRDHRRSIHR